MLYLFILPLAESVISCPVNDLLYEPSPRPLGSPLPSMGEGTGARAGYRNCLYGHDITSVMSSVARIKCLQLDRTLHKDAKVAADVVTDIADALSVHPTVGGIRYIRYVIRCQN